MQGNDKQRPSDPDREYVFKIVTKEEVAFRKLVHDTAVAMEPSKRNLPLEMKAEPDLFNRVVSPVLQRKPSFLNQGERGRPSTDEEPQFSPDRLGVGPVPRSQSRSPAQPFTAAMAGAPFPALDWPAPALRHLFKVNCFDILNKSHRSATLENLKTILDRFAKSPATRLFVSHCTQDEGMQLFNTAELYFSEKGHKVFNPTTEFQKIEASTPTMVAAVRASQVVIAALSPKLFTSKWCLAELVAAHDADIPVVAVFAGDFCSNAQMERWVGGNFN